MDQLIGLELTLNNPTSEIVLAGNIAQIDKKMSGVMFSHLKAAVTNFKNAFHAVACLVMDVVLTIIAAIAAIFGKEGRNMLRAQLGHILQDIVSIPVSLFGMIFPQSAGEVAADTKEFAVKVFA